MNYLSNSRSTKELQNIDLNHHFHPFTSTSDIKDGARIIKRVKVFIFGIVRVKNILTLWLDSGV